MSRHHQVLITDKTPANVLALARSSTAASPAPAPSSPPPKRSAARGCP
ncbi:hypothetical protein [Streptomyces sp. NPDC002067]